MKQTKLISLRENARLTHEEVAQCVGISRSFYTQIEQGTRKPSVTVLLKIANFFNVQIEEFFLLNGDSSCNTDEHCATAERPSPAA